MKSFKTRLKVLLMFGTIAPIIFLIGVFTMKYYSINSNLEDDLFSNQIHLFSSEVEVAFNNISTPLIDSYKFVLAEDVDPSVKQGYFDGLIGGVKGLTHYYYIDENSIMSNNSDKNKVKVKTVSFLDNATDNEVNIYVLKQFNDKKLYFSYGSSFGNESSKLLVFEIDSDVLFNNLARYTKYNEIEYGLFFKDSTVISSKSDFKITEIGVPLLRKKVNDEYFLMARRQLAFDRFSFIVEKNISVEMLFMQNATMKLFFVIEIYIFILSIVIILLTRLMTSPLDKLFEFLKNTKKPYRNLKNIDTNNQDYKEIFMTFNDMVTQSKFNVQEIERQTGIIEEKNMIMEELNDRLDESLEEIDLSNKELYYLEKKSKSLIDNINDLMWLIDSTGKIIYINKVVEDKLGYKAKNLVGIKLENILKASFENEDNYQEIFYHDIDDMELIFQNQNSKGEEIYSVSTQRIYSNDQLIQIQGVCREITEEKFIDAQMKQKKIVSEALNEISEILTKPEKLDVLLNHIVVRIERLLNPLVCTIRLLDERGRLELMAGIGEFYSLIQEKYLDVEKDISGKAIKEGKIIIISDNSDDYYENYYEVHTIVNKSNELIFFPLEYDNKIIGVMSIGLKDVISDVNLKILQVFTNQASAAIEKSRLYSEIENNYVNIIKALASTVEAKDSYTEDHSNRVSMYSRLIAEELELSDEEIDYIEIAGLLHDIGKIGVSDSILVKEGKLTDDEFREIKKHTLNGGRIVSEMKLHHYIVEGVLLHHKRFDLKGYPDIILEELPLAARIIGVADAFDAMTSDRSYQSARSTPDALYELKREAGTQFCPKVVKAIEVVISKMIIEEDVLRIDTA